MERETHIQLDRIEQLLTEIAYELNILDENNEWIQREERDEDIKEEQQNNDQETKHEETDFVDE